MKHPIPILSRATHDRIVNAVASFTHRKQWKSWGLSDLREQGAAILFHGPPGTGKTITAYHLAQKLRKDIHEISMATFGSHIPGELARNINTIFMSGGIRTIIFIDECDAVLIDRERLGPDMVWMLEPINALLSQIGQYPGLVIMATNQIRFLDGALERRLLDKVEFTRPAYAEREVMWQHKIPAKFPVKPTINELAVLAEFDLTGAEIETNFLLWAGEQLNNNRTPTIESLIQFISNRI